MSRNYTYTGPSGTFTIGDLVFVRDVPTATDDATIDYLRGTFPAHQWVLTGNDGPSITSEPTTAVAERAPTVQELSTTSLAEVLPPPPDDLAAGLQAVSEAAVQGVDAMDQIADAAKSAKATEDKAE